MLLGNEHLLLGNERLFLGIIGFSGFVEFFFCCWGVLGLRGSGGPVGVFENISDKNLASMGPGILPSVGVGVCRKAPEALPDSNTTLNTFQSAIVFAAAMPG